MVRRLRDAEPMDVSDLPNVTVLGARVHGPTLHQALAIMEEWIRDRDGRARMIIATGFHGLWVGHQDPAFRKILNEADLFCPDGIAPVWLSRLHGRALPARVPGPDLLEGFLHRANASGHSSYFYGDTEETLSALRERVAARFPNAKIAGSFSPPFDETSERDQARFIQRINEARPDVLWVGLGCPKQERWMARSRALLNVPVIVAVGAAFRFQAGLVSRAPRLWRESGLEWAWRLAAEPRKLWRRDLVDGPRFVFAALRDAWRVRHPGDRPASDTRSDAVDASGRRP